MKNFLEEFADRLKELRTEKGLTISALAEATGIGSSSISRWEKIQAEIKSGQLMILADFFGVTVDYLLGREDDCIIKNNHKNK